MTVIGTVEEINRVLRCINPNYPTQNLDTLTRNHCFYVMNEVPVEVVIHNPKPAGECKHEVI